MKELDDILESYVGMPRPDETRTLDVTSSDLSDLESVYDTYMYVIDQTDNEWLDKSADYYMRLLKRPYTGEEINRFLQRTIRYENRKHYASATGSFITKLIQTAYQSGENDFSLNTTAIPCRLDSFGFALEGTDRNLVRVNVEGDLGDGCFAKTRFVDIVINGAVGLRGCWDTYFTRALVKGKVGECFGVTAEYSKFIMEGNVGASFGLQAKNCVVEIKGFAGHRLGSESSESSFEIVSGLVGDECGAAAKKAKFTIDGHVADRLGWDAQDSEFVVNGSVSFYCGISSYNSRFTIEGSVNKGCGAQSRDCEFKSHDVQVAKRMLRWVGMRSNVYHILPGGSHVRLWRFRDHMMNWFKDVLYLFKK